MPLLGRRGNFLRYFRDPIAAMRTYYGTLYFPNPVMDAPLVTYNWPGMLFVSYLRLSFTWGGFAGFSSQPEAAAAARDELTFLTRDLVPI